MSILSRIGQRLGLTRSFEGASAKPKTSGYGHHFRHNTEIATAQLTVRQRARHLVANNPYVANGVANLVTGLVGSGVRIAPREPNDQIVSDHETWADRADMQAATDLYGLQAQMAFDLAVDGESLAICYDEGGEPRILHVPIEQLDSSKTADLANGGCIHRGVELDQYGRTVGFWIHPHRPVDALDSYRPSVRIPAEDVLYVVHRQTAGQVRGISWLAPIIVPSNELSQLQDALLVGAKVAAMHAGFIRNTGIASGGPEYDGTVSGGTLEGGLEPGTLKVLPYGSEIVFSAPDSFKEAPAFLRHYLQSLSAGLGIPEFLLSGDLTSANYSSLRAGLLPFKQRMERIQYSTIAPQYVLPIFRRWAAYQVASGRLSEIPAVDAIFPRFPSVDPAKEAEAIEAMLRNGISSRSRCLNELGWSAADVDKEIAADRKREAELGLSFGPQPAKKEAPPNE